eukprot:g40406.t1
MSEVMQEAGKGRFCGDSLIGVVNDQRGIHNKLMVCSAVVVPTLLYGSEMWAIYSRHLEALEQDHQRCLCKILQIHWEERRTNASIFNWVNFEAQTTLDRLRWAGYIIHMTGTRLPQA